MDEDNLDKEVLELVFRDLRPPLDSIEESDSKYYFRRLDERNNNDRLKSFNHHLVTGNHVEIAKLLRDGKVEGFDPFSCTFYERLPEKLKPAHPLEIAAKYGHLECLEVMIQETWRTLKPEFYRDAMLQAVCQGHLDCFHLLMDGGLSKSHWFKTQCLHLLEACRLGDFDQIQSFICEDIPGELSGRNGSNVMNLLLSYGCPPSCLEILIEKGYDVNEFDVIGLPPLTCAVLAQNVDCIEFLLSFGSDINGITFDTHRFGAGKTALMYAASLNNIRPLELLLQFCNKTDIELSNCLSWNAMTFACCYGNRSAVEALLQAGAVIERKDHRENTTIIPAMKSGNPDFLKYFLSQVSEEFYQYTVEMSKDRKCIVEHADCLNILLDHFHVTDLERPLANGRTFLTLAASEGFLDSVHLLLDRGADIDGVDSRGDTALLCSCRQDHFEIVQLLVERGTDVNIQHSFDSSAVMYAVSCENVNCLELLLNSGADVHKPDMKYGKVTTVFTLALEGLDVDCLEVLLNSTKIVQNGELSPIHMNATGFTCHQWNNFSPKTLGFIFKHGLFSWEWCSPYIFRTLAFTAVFSGVCPGRVNYSGMKMYPLTLAFMRGEVSMVKYLLSSLYFLPDDYAMLCCNETVREAVSMHKSSDLLTLLDQVTLQPMSLQVWSFLAVSKGISLAGTPVRRAERVECLPLPGFLKRKLMFQSDVSKVCRSMWCNIDIEDKYVGQMLFQKRLTSPAKSCNSDCFYCRGLGVQWGKIS